MNKKNNYVVSVGNVGNIEFTNKSEALNTYREYIRQSKSNYGRAAGESVVLFLNGEILNEYVGTVNECED